MKETGKAGADAKKEGAEGTPTKVLALLVDKDTLCPYSILNLEPVVVRAGALRSGCRGCDGK
jgi:hypothetical protein